MIHSLLKKIQRATAALLLAALPFASQGAQILEGTEGQIIYGKLSVKELSRIRVQNDRIETVRGRTDVVNIEPDREAGEVYLRPRGAVQPVNLFIKTTSGRTYTLLLQPEDIPSTNIVVVDSRGRGTLATKESKESAGDYQLTLKRFMLAIMRGEVGSGVALVEEGRRIPLWKDTHFTLDRMYKTDDLIGEVYTLTNEGPTRLVMTEPEFYRPGVLAVTVERMQLDPSASTGVFIVRRTSSRD